MKYLATSNNTAIKSKFSSVYESAKIEPLTITENGTYTASEIDGYNPVTVEVPIPSDTTATAEDIKEGKTAYIGGEKVTGTAGNKIKRLFDITKTCEKMFYLKTYTIEDVQSLIEFNNTENVTNMYGMFSQGGVLNAMPPMNTQNVITMNNMFSGQSNLTTAYHYETKNVTDFTAMVDLTPINEIPLYNTSNAKTAERMVQRCYNLKKIPAFDFRNCDNLNNFCTSDRNLEEIWIKNIKANLQVGSHNAYGHLLKQESAIHLLYELRDTGSAKTITFSTTTGELLANVYVKSIPITDEMRAEDDLIDEKLPFVICESTDEGATLITEYVLQKNWQVALA